MFLLRKSVVHSETIFRRLLRPKSCYRSSLSQIFSEPGVLKNFVKLTEEYMNLSLICLESGGLQRYEKRDSDAVIFLWVLRQFLNTFKEHGSFPGEYFCRYYLKHQLFSFSVFCLSSDVYLSTESCFCRTCQVITIIIIHFDSCTVCS